MAVYVDTSALAKWYVRESRSDEFEDWLRQAHAPTISSLTMVEMRCLLARRRRMGSLDDASAAGAHALFLQDIEQRHLVVQALQDADVRAAAQLLEYTRDHALRTLDALHLAVCSGMGVERLATADAVMAAAAEDLGMAVERFD